MTDIIDTFSFVIIGGPCAPPDPCEGVVCENKCYGVDLHETVCQNGVCVKGALVEANSAACGYVPPPPDATIENVAWTSRNPHTGEESDVACYGAPVDVTVNIRSNESITRQYKVRMVIGSTVVDSAPFSLSAYGWREVAMPAFTMPETTHLDCRAELVYLGGT